MSEKIAQGKAGIVATKKSDPVIVSNALLTDSQSKSGSNESLASEMETVIIQGTDFAKEFEKPNDRASHIKIGRAKQKVISGGQGSILQCTSVSSVASGNAGKTTATPQKTATKPSDGPCRTSDLEGSAGSNSCAVKSALKKVTPTGTASVTAPAKTGHVASKANVNVSSKSGNIANANKPNNMLSRPTPPVAVSGRPVEVAANIGHRPNFPNMRSTIQAPAGVFPGAVQPRGRGPGTNFNPQRPASRMHANLFNAGRPNVQVVNVRNPRSMTPSSGYGAVRPALGITRPTGPMPVRLASGCPVNKMDVRRPNAANSTVRQRPLVPDKPSVKPCLNTPTKPGIPEANKINSMNNAVESSRKNAEKLNPVNKASPHPVTTKIGCAGSVSASIKPTENAVKACNHTATKPVDNVSLGSNKSCAQGGSSSNSNISNTVKTAGKPVTTNPPQSGSNQLFKVSSNNTTGNKTVKPTNPDTLETTKTQTPAQPPPPPPPPPSSSTCDNVDVLPSQPSTASEKEQNVADSAGTCDNDEALEDAEGSKGGISFSFNRKMGQKLPSSVPFGKEEEKAPNSADTEKDSKTEAVKEESCTEKSQDSNKEMPSAGMSFLKVLNKEQTLELDWPVEMIRYTKTEPSISYSCNPLFFDFKELLSKDKCHKEENTSSNQMKKKSDGDASVSKTEPNNADEKEKETKNQVNADAAKAEKSLVKKSRKKKRKLSSQRHTDEDEMKSKKKKKKKHSSKKREVKSEGGISEKEDDKNAVDVSKNKRHKKKKKRSHHLGPKSDLEQGHGEGGDGDGVTKSKTSHKSKHKKHKSRKSKKKRHKHDEFEKDSNSGHESEEDLAASAVTEQKNKKHKKKKPPQAGKDSSNFSSEDELSKVQKAKSKVASSGIAGEKVIAATAGEPDGKLATVAVCEEEKDVSKKRNVAGNNPTQTLESVDESKKTKKDEAGAAKPGSCTERKRPTGELDSPVGSKKKKLSSKTMCLKSEDTWSKMETIFEARSDPEGNKASWDTSSDSDVASHENKPNIKSKSADAGKRKKLPNPSEPSEKPENNPNPASKTSGSAVKVEPNNSSGSESDRPASAKQIYKRKKSYSGESHHSDSHCRSRDRSYSSSYSDRDSHYSDKSKHRHSRSHSSSRSRSRSRSASYERHSSRRGRRYSYSSYSDEDYRYRRGHSRSRSCSRRRSRTRSRSYSRSRRYRSYSSEHHRSYSSSSSRSRSRSESRGRSRSYSYSRSHSKSTSYSRSRSRSRSYHKSHSRSRSPHKSSKQDYRHKSSPEHRYYSSKKNSKHVSGGKGENEKGGKLDPAKIPLPIMPGDDKEEAGEGPEKSKDKMFPAETTKVSTPAAVTPGPEVAPTLHAVRKEVTVAGGTGEPEAKSGLINIPLPPFQVAENAQLGKVDSVDGQLRPPPPPPHMLSMTHYTNTGDCLMHHPIPDLSQPPPSASLMANCPPPPPPPPPPMLNNNNNSNIPGMPATRLGAPSLYGHLSIPPQDVPRMNAPPPPPPPKCGVDASMRMPLPFTPRSVTRLEQSSKENPSVSKSPIESTLQAPSAAATVETAEKEMTPPLPPPKSPPPQPPPPPKKEDEKKNCEEISPMQPIIPPEQVEQYKHLQEMAQKHAMKQQRRQRLKDTGQAEESDDDESMEMEGQVSTMVSDEECEEQPGILALPEPEPQHLQQQILLPHAQHAGSPVIAQHVVPFSQQQIIIPPSSLLQSQGAAFPIQTGGPMIAIPHTAAAHHHHHHPHHPLAGHHALHHAFHPAAAAGVPLAAAAASHPFHHQLIAAAPSQLVPYSSPQPILTQLHPPGPIIIGHQILIPRFPRAPM
ncbi:unnamed protein product [Acanthosepion pharaonis]|uniref:Uncharacterized protein n=1 Tax=Acanthosepion pharaonis TaxID=158019 RepID=A0A812EJV6_ACAPH|nr:unnamed protein product [Sepia pharaonis]